MIGQLRYRRYIGFDDFDESKNHRENVENEWKAKRWSSLKKLGKFVFLKLVVQLGFEVPFGKG